MQSTPKFTGNYLICTHLKSPDVTHLKTRQVSQKNVILKIPEGVKGACHIDPISKEIGLSLYGNVKVKETTAITFTNLGQNLKVY